MLKLSDSVIKKILPRALVGDEFVAVLADAFEIQMCQLYGEIHEKHDLQRIDGIEEKLLDYIAFEKHIDFYEYDTDIKRKRELIKHAILHHRKKGTKWAIEDVVKIFYKNAKVTEWYEYDGQPYHFNVEVTATEGLAGNEKGNAREQLIKMIETIKNVRSWFDGFILLLGEETILLIEKTYHYPVFFEYCNHVHGTSHMQEYEADEINIENQTYDYPVRFFACEIKSMLFSDKEHIQEQSYQYPVIFDTCGEMDPINASFQEQRYEGDIRDETYMFLQKLNTCGEFVCE